MSYTDARTLGIRVRVVICHCMILRILSYQVCGVKSPEEQIHVWSLWQVFSACDIQWLTSESLSLQGRARGDDLYGASLRFDRRLYSREALSLSLSF